MSKVLPRYPIFIPSKGRFDESQTAKFLDRDGVPFRLVVELKERDEYAKRFGDHRVVVLPWDNPPGTKDGLIKSRNFIRDLAVREGHARHWQLDDNIVEIRRWYKGKRIPCDSGPAFACVEDFSDRYENVAISGMNYQMFCVDPSSPAYYLNVHVYSCTLVLNSMPYRWRLAYNDDTDLCLQALTGGWCTVLFNAFMANKIRTGVVKGGNTDAIYRGDGRLKMSRALERVWPYVVQTGRRFKRPQHIVRDSWRKFDTPLRLRPGVDLSKIKPNEYGLDLVAVKDAIKSDGIRSLVEERSRGRTK